ncbi:MAG: hypothetical protein JW882_05800 [Deltaproteobacteria bacterium]|nr:hypothetical protein [Deltaproteobacteria bacterium]
MNIGIVGARKYKDKQSVMELANSIPAENRIITSGCKGVCTWVKEIAEQRGMEVILFKPDLSNIRSWFDVPKRYYQRNKEMIEVCNVLHAFISAENGYTGGTRFEIEYAATLNIPVKVHRENGESNWIYQYFLPFIESEEAFLLSWQDFFRKIL